MSEKKSIKEGNAVMDSSGHMNDEVGRIHIYEGEGRGKTTAAVGLAVRFAGTGGNVLFTQFLKKNDSGELKILIGIPNVELILCEQNFGFTFQMTPERKQEAAAYYSGHLSRVLAAAKQMEGRSLLVLDEILAAYNQNMVRQQELLDFLREKPENLEIVLTGRNPAPELSAFADYITAMEKKKHPFDDGVPARQGIEW